jgi:hypothetical protein
MLNPADILDALVAKLQGIPALVTALTSASNIVAFHHSWPTASYLQAALLEMKAPGILVVWRESGPGTFGNSEVWKHTFSLIVRPPEATVGSANYGALFALVVNGISVDTGRAVTSIAVASNVATATLPATHGLVVGDTARVSGATEDADLNDDYAVLSVPTDKTLTFATSGVSDGTYTEATLRISRVGRKLLNDTIHPSCYPMEVPTFTRQTIMVTPEASLDYFEVRISLVENGDN